MISIIIPVYNTPAEFLEECIRSILIQSYKEFEVLLIDDGSNESCAAQYDSLFTKEVRIKLVHCKKGGVSQARNEGLRLAQGEWILFVDGDDWLETDALSQLMNHINENIDIVFGRNYYVQEENVTPNFYRGEKTNIIEGKRKDELYETIFYGRSNLFSSGAMSWCKLYRKSMLNEYEIRFPLNLAIGEDGCFNFQAFYYARKVLCIDTFLYYYRKHNESVCESFHEDLPETCSRFLGLMKQYLSSFELYDRYKNELGCLTMRYWEMYILKKYLYASSGNTKNKINHLRELSKNDENIQLWQVGSNYHGKKKKLLAYMIRHRYIWCLAYFRF